MVKKSAGILLFRYFNKNLEVFLVHPGGPFFNNKDEGSWSIPKGEIEDTEFPMDAAIREFQEETGIKLAGPFIELMPIKQKSGKLVYAWAMEGDLDPSTLKCNRFTIEWPPKSGRFAEFPEIDKGEWFSVNVAAQKILQAQAALISELEMKLQRKENMR